MQNKNFQLLSPKPVRLIIHQLCVVKILGKKLLYHIIVLKRIVINKVFLLFVQNSFVLKKCRFYKAIVMFSL